MAAAAAAAVALAAAVDALRGSEGEAEGLVPERPAVRGQLTVAAAVPVAHPTRLAAGEGFVWATDDAAGTLTRIDPADASAPVTVRVGHRPTALAAGLGAVWVLEEETRSLLRVSPRTLEVLARIGLPFVPTELALAARAVWVTGYGGSALARVDVPRGRVGLVAPVDRPTSVAVAGGRVWVLRPDAAVVSAFDPDTGSAVHEVPVAAFAAARPEKLVAAAGDLWLTVPALGLLAQLDPRRSVLVRLLRLPRVAAPFDVAADGDVLWFQSLTEVVRLEPGREPVLAAGSIRLARHPGPEPLGLGGLAPAGGTAWVADTHGSAVIAVSGAGG